MRPAGLIFGSCGRGRDAAVRLNCGFLRNCVIAQHFAVETPGSLDGKGTWGKAHSSKALALFCDAIGQIDLPSVAQLAL